MKTLAKACKPRDSIFDKARRDTVLDLSDLAQDRIDAAAFFGENHTTEGMRILLTEGFRRLEGKTTQGVFKLAVGTLLGDRRKDLYDCAARREE